MPNAEYKQDLDGGFVGFESRTNASLLKAQYLQYSQNTRLERGHATVRKGNTNVTPSDLLDQTPLMSCVYVTREGVEKIAVVTTNKLFIYDPNASGTTQFFNLPRSVSPSDKGMVFQAIDHLFIVRGEPATPRTGTVALVNGSSTATVTASGHGFTVGQEVIISGIVGSTYANGAYTVTTVNGGSFTYTLSAPSTNNHSGVVTYQAGKPPIKWDGVNNPSLVTQGDIDGVDANFPPCEVAMFYGNRIIAKRDRDKIAASDYLDYNMWDLTFGQFTINQGANDRIVGFTPWADNEFLIFERNSIYRAKIVNSQYVVGEGPDSQSFIQTVTNAFGCVSPKAIVNAGRFVFFLSDGGIYMLEPQLDLRLINTLEPLSAPINNLVERIKRNISDKSVGIYHSNRLYMAVPLTDAGNDTVLVFNTLNKAWESVDTFPPAVPAEGVQPALPPFTISNLLECVLDDRKRLFCVSNQGIYLMEDATTGDEVDADGITVLDAQLGATGLQSPDDYGFFLDTEAKRYYPVKGEIKSRKFTYANTNEKRFASTALELEFSGNCSIRTTVKVYNPDATEVVDNFTDSGTNDVIRRVAIGKRGFAADVTVSTLDGQPTLKSMSIDATAGGRLTKSEK
jgi:hypothetical protein